VMLGSQRIGPDLANVGVRLPDANWHFRHLYDPTSVVPKSVMPPYRFLFEERTATRAIDGQTSNAFTTDMATFSGSRTNFANGEALPAAPRAAEIGVDFVPTEDARALVAYLLSLRANTPLLERPLTVSAPSTPAATTTATAGVNTNATAL
jgi:cytochrome c oxidase cbb3-type subunit II